MRAFSSFLAGGVFGRPIAAVYRVACRAASTDTRLGRLPTLRIHLPAAVLLVALAGIRPAPAQAQVRLAPPRPTIENMDSLAAANAKNPGDLETALRYARALALENSISSRKRAGEVLQRARRDHPHSAELHLALADLYYRQGFLTLSRNELKNAIQADSS